MTSLSPHSPDTPSFRKLFVVEAKPETQQTAHSKRNPAARTLRVSSYIRLTPASEARISPHNWIFRFAQSDGGKRFTRHASPNPIDSVSLTKIILPITKSEFFC